MRTKDPWFKFNPAAFLTDTASWHPDEVGAWIRILSYQWINHRVPADVKSLSNLTGLSKKKCAEFFKKVENKISMIDGKYFVNTTLQKLQNEKRKDAERHAHYLPEGTGKSPEYERNMNGKSPESSFLYNNIKEDREKEEGNSEHIPSDVGRSPSLYRKAENFTGLEDELCRPGEFRMNAERMLRDYGCELVNGNYQRLVQAFISKLLTEPAAHKTLGDARQHFVNWAKREWKILLQNHTTQPQKTSRAAVPD